MFKWTFLEIENIVEPRTGLHLSLRGLDVEIIAIKYWWSVKSLFYSKGRGAGRGVVSVRLHKNELSPEPWFFIFIDHLV